MVDLILLVMVIASGVSLLVVSPRQAPINGLPASTEEDDMESINTNGRDEDSLETVCSVE